MPLWITFAVSFAAWGIVYLKTDGNQWLAVPAACVPLLLLILIVVYINR